MAKNIDVPMLRFSDNPFSDKLSEKIDNSEWKKNRIAMQNKYASVMQNLQDNGLDTVKLDTLMEQRNNKKAEITFSPIIQLRI